MPETGPFNEWAPDPGGEVVLDEEVPEAIRFFIEVAHGEIRRDGAELARSAAPNGAMRKESAVSP